jgi:RNA-directed DNA polymerase
MASMGQFLTPKLRLKINEAKSAVARPDERKFLGFSISNDGSERRIAAKAPDKFKARIRVMTRRTRGASLPCRRPRALPQRMAWILPLLSDPTGAHELGSVDPPKTAYVSLAAV